MALEVWSKVMNEGDNDEEFPPSDTIMAFRFAECPACISNDMLITVIVKLR